MRDIFIKEIRQAVTIFTGDFIQKTVVHHLKPMHLTSLNLQIILMLMMSDNIIMPHLMKLQDNSFLSMK